MIAFLLACATVRPVPPTIDVDATTRPLRAELVSEGRISTRLAKPDEADLVVFYSAEQQGDLGPCGCPTRPRGGLARMAAYMDASRAQPAAPPSIVLNSGQWLEDAIGMDGNPRADMPLLNQWMIRGQVALAPDALNVSNHEVAGLSAIGGDSGGLPLVSANVKGPGIQPTIVVKRGDLTIAITGITAVGVTLQETPGYTMTEPYAAAKDALDGLDVDVRILLSYQARKAAKKLAEEGWVDLVVDAHRHRTLDEPSRIGSALWVRAHFQAMRMGELRLGIDDQHIRWALDRKIDLDDGLPDQRSQAEIYKAARAELKTIETQLYGAPKR